MIWARHMTHMMERTAIKQMAKWEANIKMDLE
jgi:hypothetical protein